MQRLDRSIHAARVFLTILGFVGGGSAAGHWIRPGAGMVAGFIVGWVLVAGQVGWLHWRRRRGDAWIEAGRTEGFRGWRPGHCPLLALPGYEEPANLLGGEIAGARVVIGDRMQRYVVFHRKAAVGTWETNRPHTSEPVPVETFIAVWIPGRTAPPFALGRRRSLLGRDSDPPPAGAAGEALRRWCGSHPGWRVEGRGDLLVATRPHRLAAVTEVPELAAAARALVDAGQVGVNDEAHGQNY